MKFNNILKKATLLSLITISSQISSNTQSIAPIAQSIQEKQPIQVSNKRTIKAKKTHKKNKIAKKKAINKIQKYDLKEQLQFNEHKLNKLVQRQSKTEKKILKLRNAVEKQREVLAQTQKINEKVNVKNDTQLVLA